MPLACLVLACPSKASAQTTTHSDGELILANVSLSAAAAGLAGVANGRSFWRSAVGGGLGGFVSFGGKRIIASDSHALGFIGRELSAIGASVTRNAMIGHGLLDRLTLPLGPLRVHVGTNDEWSADVQVDLNAATWLVYGLMSERLVLDLDRSLRTGAFVFWAREDIATEHDVVTVARAGDGAVFVSRSRLEASPHVFEHELIHVAQTDFLQIVFGTPVEEALLTRLGARDLPALGIMQLGGGYYPFLHMARVLVETEADSFQSR